jgi:tight adherence protein C
MFLIAVTFLATFCFTGSVGLLVFRRDAVMQRLSDLVGTRTVSSGELMQRLVPRRQSSVETIVKPFQNILPRSPAEVSVLQRRLIRAGYRDQTAVNIFYGAKVIVPISLAVLVTVTGAYRLGPFFMYGVSLGIGFLLPDFWVSNRIKNRQLKIRVGLPEALDLMVICTEAGLGLDQTVYRVGNELKLSQPEIRDEFHLINLEQHAGRPREDALKNFADRVNTDNVRALVNTLIQADNFGTNISKTLRVYSDSLRTQRRQQAEELAAKTTVKLVFPLVLFIFPSIFVVTLGPAVITLVEGFTKYFLNQ